MILKSGRRNKTEKLLKYHAMKAKGKMKMYSLDELTDKYIGKRGTPKREAFEHELRLETLGAAIKEARQQRKLT